MEKHIIDSLTKSNNLSSNINNFCLQIEGMTGIKTRHFYNNICSMDNCRYLEVGSWKGSSICSALCNNSISAVAIDNFQMSTQSSSELFKICTSNINQVKGSNSINFFNENCWNFDINKIKDYKFNVYMYDGNHEEESHFKALTYYISCLDNVFIYIVDDWTDKRVRDGTQRAIKHLDLKVKYIKEIRLTDNNTHTPVSVASKDYWNGMAVYLLEK